MISLRTLLLGCAVLAGCLAVRADVSPEKLEIVIGANPSKTEAFAASELSRYIGRMTGAAPEVLSGQSGKAFPIYLGRAADRRLVANFNHSVAHIEHDAFVIEVLPDRINAIGNSDRGTLYAAYELLEQQGCRWFFPGKLGECIPEKVKLSFPEGKREFVPDFNQRTIDIGATEGIDFGEMIDWAAKNRLNFLPAARTFFVRKFLPPEQQDIWEKRGGQQEWQFHVHNLNQMLPAEKYFKDHPEYYALYKGRRHPIGTPSRPGYGGGNICTTNPEVIDICAKFIIDYFDSHPEGMIVPVWPGDGAIIWCECPECKKLKGVNFMNGRRGSMSRRMITFGNAVARKVAEKYPDRKVLVPAYANYIRPVDIPLEPNVILQYCLHGDYAHGVNRCDHNKAEREQLEGWAAISRNQLGVWEYFLLGDHYSAPTENSAMLPVLYRIKYTLPYFKSIGMNNYMTQSSPKYWKHNMAAYYLTAKYAWNADRDFNALLDDFCRNMYGKAGDKVRDYYLLVEDAVERSDWHPSIYSDLSVPSPKVFTPAVLERAAGLLKEAQEAELSDIERERLNLVLDTFRHIQSNIGTRNALGVDAKTEWRIQRGKDVYVMNPDGRELSDLDVKRLVTNALDVGNYSDDFKRILFRARKRNMPVLELRNAAVTVGVIPELGGRIIRMTDNRTGRNFFEEPASDGKTSIGEKYFNYGGYEEYIGKSFAGPGWESSYQAEVESGAVRMSFADDTFRLERTVSLPLADQPVMRIESVLTNLSGESVTTALRTHPLLAWNGEAGDVRVELSQPDGSVRTSTVNLEHDKSTAVHGGRCVLSGADGGSLEYTVDPAGEGALYFCKTSPRTFTLEFLGKERTLKPGESIRIVQQFTIHTNTK